MKKLRRNIKQLVAQGQIQQALGRLVAPQSPLHNSFLLLSQRYHTLRQLFDQGLVTLADYQVEMNRIAKGILVSVDGLETNAMVSPILKKI